jgi:hypothetical protein
MTTREEMRRETDKAFDRVLEAIANVIETTERPANRELTAPVGRDGGRSA